MKRVFNIVGFMCLPAACASFFTAIWTIGDDAGRWGGTGALLLWFAGLCLVATDCMP